jgi:hypothetical protein
MWNCATPSVVNGFLNSNAGCFIATAAYNNSWDPRLETLRQFRDMVLNRFSLGRALSHWYSSWSPPAARWILAHPQAQWPVKVLLFPLFELAAFTLWVNENFIMFSVIMVVFAIAFVLSYVRKHEAN